MEPTFDWIIFLNQIFQALITSVVASLLFFLLLRCFRPRITIAPQICLHGSKDKKHVIKVVNKSRTALLDVRGELALLTPFTAPNGRNFNKTQIKLKKDSISSIPRYYSRKSKDPNASYAIWFTVEEDIDVLLNEDDGANLEFTVIARHGFSGLVKEERQQYFHKATDIKTGSYKFGIDTTIV